MNSDTITIRVGEEAARIFNAATPDEQRKLEALLALQLLAAPTSTPPLTEVMRMLGERARERGLTPEILQEILDESAF